MKYNMKDFINSRIAINVRNTVERDKFLEMCEAHGLRWRTGTKPTQGILLTNYGDKLCIACDGANSTENTICYADTNHFRKNDWTVIKFSDFVPEKKGNEFCIVIECTDGRTTTAELIKRGKDGTAHTVKTVTAKCNPVDLFNLRIGAQTAFDRLWERSSE